MSTCFARTMLLGLSLYASLASAKPFQSMDTIEVSFKPAKSVRYSAAYATLNYGSDTLVLTLNPVCPAGMMCAAVLPEPETFESVNSTVDRCGVVKSVALIDNMPVDGVRTEVTLIDNSAYSCRGRKPAPAATLNVKKEWYNRLQGKKVQAVDSFRSNKVETVVAFQGVIAAELESLTSQAFIGGSLFLDAGKGSLQLTLNPVKEPCPAGMMCTQEMPEPQTYEFANAQTEVDSCGIIRTTASFDDRPVDGIAMTVTINNNRNNTCPTFAPLSALDVTVQTSRYARGENNGEVYVETLDTLKADDIALIKPGK